MDEKQRNDFKEELRKADKALTIYLRVQIACLIGSICTLIGFLIYHVH